VPYTNQWIIQNYDSCQYTVVTVINTKQLLHYRFWFSFVECACFMLTEHFSCQVLSILCRHFQVVSQSGGLCCVLLCLSTDVSLILNPKVFTFHKWCNFQLPFNPRCKHIFVYETSQPGWGVIYRHVYILGKMSTFCFALKARELIYLHVCGCSWLHHHSFTSLWRLPQTIPPGAKGKFYDDCCTLIVSCYVLEPCINVHEPVYSLTHSLWDWKCWCHVPVYLLFLLSLFINKTFFVTFWCHYCSEDFIANIGKTSFCFAPYQGHWIEEGFVNIVMISCHIVS